MQTYTKATPKAGHDFYKNFNKKGSFVMLNLLKFKDFTDYTSTSQITGKEAYNLYLKGIQPLLKEMGSMILFYGKGYDFLVGPENEKWDATLLVQHPSVEKFIAFSQSDAYLTHAIHLKAALLDSRLLPLSESTLNL